MHLKLREAQFLKKKLISIFKNEEGYFVLNFALLVPVLLLLIMFAIQVGLVMIEQTEIQTATDAASLAGVTTIRAEPKAVETEIIDGEVVITVTEWEIIKDLNEAEREAKRVYFLNNSDKDASDIAFTGSFPSEDSVNNMYSYKIEVEDQTKPLILWKSLFNDDFKYHQESTAKTKIFIP